MKKRLKQTFTVTWLAAILIVTNCKAQNIDIDLLKSINQHQSSFKNGFTDVTAGSVNVIVVAAPFAILTAGLIKKDKKLQLDAAYFAGGYIFSAAVTQGLKRLVKRPRPFVTYPFIIKRENETNYSFPSGHTSSAFYDAVSLSILFPKWYVIASSLLWASSVGYARMYQGVHYPSDVVVGAMVGAGSAWLAYKTKQWINKKRTDRLKKLPEKL